MELWWTRLLGCRDNTALGEKAGCLKVDPCLGSVSKPTTNDAQTGLEAVVGTLQLQLMVHLGVDVLQRRQSRTSRVAVVPAHQRQPAHEQVLADLQEETGNRC